MSGTLEVGPAADENDPRHKFIARVAPGKSFIDIGGLNLGNSERVSVAHAAGARSVALMDVEAPGCPWWRDVEERLIQRGVKDCDFVSGDVLTYDLPPYDVVFSSGILYHLPSPVLYLSRLRSIARDYCILTASTAPTRMVVGDQSLSIPEAATIFVPALEGREKEIVLEWYKRRGREDVTEPREEFGGHRNLSNYYANWFIPTVPAFRAMAVCAGFEIIDEAPVEPEDLSHCLLLRPSGPR